LRLEIFNAGSVPVFIFSQKNSISERLKTNYFEKMENPTMKWRIVPLSVKRSRQTEGDALLRKGETLHDPQGQGRFCCAQSLVQGCLALIERLPLAGHGRDMPGMVQREAMIG